jgi:mannose-1-phosphate guanylyltransferase/mannose-6-phosphate isomerase
LETVKNAYDQVGDHLGTIGIKPTRPDTGYGYIRKGENKKYFFTAKEFKEKPDLKTAEKYLESKEYVWNGGKYIFNSKTFWSEISLYAPEIDQIAKKGFEFLKNNFSSLPSISIDYALSEKSKNIVIFEGDFGWSDIGSFENLSEIQGKNNKTRTVEIDSENI